MKDYTNKNVEPYILFGSEEVKNHRINSESLKISVEQKVYVQEQFDFSKLEIQYVKNIYEDWEKPFQEEIIGYSFNVVYNGNYIGKGNFFIKEKIELEYLSSEVFIWRLTPYSNGEEERALEEWINEAFKIGALNVY